MSLDSSVPCIVFFHRCYVYGVDIIWVSVRYHYVCVVRDDAWKFLGWFPFHVNGVYCDCVIGAHAIMLCRGRVWQCYGGSFCVVTTLCSGAGSFSALLSCTKWVGSNCETSALKIAAN